MPRDNDKDNASSRGRRDRPPGGKGRSGAARGPGEEICQARLCRQGREGRRRRARPYAGKSDGGKPYGKKPYSGAGKPYAGKRDGVPPRARDDAGPRVRYGQAGRLDVRPGSTGTIAARGDRPDKNSATGNFARGRARERRSRARDGFAAGPATAARIAGDARPRQDGERPRAQRYVGRRFARSRRPCARKILTTRPRKRFRRSCRSRRVKPWEKREASSR